MSNWYGWASLGGQLAGGQPIVAQNADGRLEVFAEVPGASGPELGHAWQLTPNGAWSGWDSLGAPTSMQYLGGSAIARNADGRLEAFARVGLMSTGALWHVWQTAPNGGWSTWDNLGGGIGPHVVVVGQNQDGRLEVFAGNTTGALQHIWQTSPGGAWSAWGDLGNPPGASLTQLMAVGHNQDGRLEFFGIASGGALWHIWQTAPNGGWSAWDLIGAPSGVTLGEIVVGTNADGRQEVFAIGNNALWHVWQTAPNGGWSNWGSLGGPPAATWLQSPAVGLNADGRLELFVLSQHDAVWHIWQTAPGAGWSGWDSLGGQPGSGPAVGQNADGRLEVFVEDAATSGPHAAWHRWQMVPNGGWSEVDPGWTTGGPAEAVSALALRPGGDLLAAGATGVWRSQDHGTSWTKVSTTLLGGSMSASPGGQVWAVSRDGKQVLESADDGATWTVRYSTASPGHLNSVLADPNAPTTIWVGMCATDNLAQVIRSTDGGATWTPLLPSSLRGGGGLSPTNAGPMAAATPLANLVLAGAQYYHGGGVLKTPDGGATWTLAYSDTYSPLAGASAVAVGGSSVASARVYAGLNVMQAGSLVRSDDGGATWSDLSGGLPIRSTTAGGVVANVALDPAHPDAVFIAMSDIASPPTTGVFASADGGHTWTEVSHLAPRVSGADGLLRDGATRMLYAATDQGVYVYSLAP